nr:MAG TPA: hypothetical protein [Caudoviricetes sp.]
MSIIDKFSNEKKRSCCTPAPQRLRASLALSIR